MYNDWNNHNHKDLYTLDERSAQWVFIREFCFGSMFRFGPTGDFNIPYGGFGYNTKCFTCKIKNITSNEARDLYSKGKKTHSSLVGGMNCLNFGSQYIFSLYLDLLHQLNKQNIRHSKMYTLYKIVWKA